MKNLFYILVGYSITTFAFSEDMLFPGPERLRTHAFMVLATDDCCGAWAVIPVSNLMERVVIANTNASNANILSLLKLIESAKIKEAIALDRSLAPKPIRARVALAVVASASDDYAKSKSTATVLPSDSQLVLLNDADTDFFSILTDLLYIRYEDRLPEGRKNQTDEKKWKKIIRKGFESAGSPVKFTMFNGIYFQSQLTPEKIETKSSVIAAGFRISSSSCEEKRRWRGQVITEADLKSP